MPSVIASFVLGRYICMTRFIGNASLKVPKWFSIDALAHPSGGHKEKLKRHKQIQLLTTVGISCIWVLTRVTVYLKLKPSSEKWLTTKIVTVALFDSKTCNFVISCSVSLNSIIIISSGVQNWEETAWTAFCKWTLIKD